MNQPTVEIRQATEEDVSSVYSMYSQLFSICGYAGICEWDQDRVLEILNTFVADEDKLLLIGYVDKLPVTFLMAAYHTSIFGKDRIAMEIAWWVEPMLRRLGMGKLIASHYKIWAKSNNCTVFALGNALGLDTEESTDKFLKRENLTPVEAIYVSRI